MLEIFAPSAAFVPDCGSAVATEVGAWLVLFCVVWFSLTVRVERSTRESGL